jgi:asparagine synthase (glutamine-hydrolysing)
MGLPRLSIIDLAGGDQPLYNEDRSVAVCFNGEIYNYVELMDELKRLGHRFTTRCDTEVLVHGYEEWGLDFLQRLNGMFAFALHDARRRELILARDRAGQKPLYYHHQNGRFVFASEVKAILEAEHVPRRCNEPVIDSYLGLRYVPQPETLFEGINVLPAAHFLRLRDHEVSIKRYWDVSLTQGPYRSEGEYLEELETVFQDAVRLTLRSDVPVAAYLSGGIDSSLVVAAAQREVGRLETFSIGFDSPVDETPQARALAQRLGCNHHEVQCLPADFAQLPRAVWHLERPIGDALILAYFKLAQATSRHAKVVLSGEGADELFAGYSFHKIILWTERWHRLMPAFLTRHVAAPLLDALPVDLLDRLFIYPAHLGRKGKAKTVAYLRDYDRRPLNGHYVALRALFDRAERESLYADGMKARGTDAWIASPPAEPGAFLDRLLKLQFDDWLQDNLLLRQDKNTMAHSLELRAPFLDHRLIELAFRMPPSLKVRGLTDKYIERRLARSLLPAENVGRSKVPFYFPLEYIRGRKEVRDLVALTLDPERVRRRGYFDPAAVQRLVQEMESGEFLIAKQVFALVILELWHMIFIDRENLL